jgi:hypothetical protein
MNMKSSHSPITTAGGALADADGNAAGLGVTDGVAGDVADADAVADGEGATDGFVTAADGDGGGVDPHARALETSSARSATRTLLVAITTAPYKPSPAA